MRKGRILGRETREVKEIFGRVSKRDFSGNTGQAVKNSAFQFSTTFVSKIGSLIFTIILARVLLPELFGLYSLALSTILIFASLADLGIDSTIVKFISSSKKDSKSKAYFSYLLRFKIKTSLISAGLLILLSKFLSYNYYNKPEIYLALVGGSVYLLLMGLVGVFEGVFQGVNNFKKGLHKEIILQTIRLVIVPVSILLLFKFFPKAINLLLIILGLSVSFLISLLFLYSSAKREIGFFRIKTEELKPNEKKALFSFIIALSAVVFSGIFFGFIDIFILGRYVEAEFIGYYRVAYSLITSAIPLITFSSALLPLFSKIRGKSLERGLSRSLRLTLLISIPSTILAVLLSPFIVKHIFGEEYLPSINILRIFSILIVILPLIALYSSFLVSQNRPRRVAQSLIVSTFVNIVLNYILIFALLPYGQIYAVYGATIATIISKVFYLVMLLIYRR
ncbi:MAG: oligosaccharide flippase family protein [Candidatus Pacearchaeota archaeon]